MNRRTLLKATAGVVLAVTSLPWANAQPDNPIRVICGFAAGGATDLLCRILSAQLAEELGQPVMVENRPGAGGRLAAEYVKRAEPDGRTFLVGPDGWAIFPSAMYTPEELRYDILKDFQPVAQVVSYPLALAIDASIPATNLQEYAAWVKANPEYAHFGTPAANGHLQFVGWMAGEALGLDLEPIAYKGSPPMLIDLLGGRLKAVILTAGEAIKQPKDKVRILGFMAEDRWEVAPEVPTFHEQGVIIEVDEAWQGVWAPAGSPASATARIEAALQRILAKPEVRQELQDQLAFSSNFVPGDQMQRNLERGLEYWGEAIKKSGYLPPSL